MLNSSSFGESAPQRPLELGGPGGQADCHRNAKVDIAGGRTGLFSNIRSNSSITLVDKRGSNCVRMRVGNNLVNFYILKYTIFLNN